jgi:peptidoglycan/LPS O-acetylase OafA/YrhL
MALPLIHKDTFVHDSAWLLMHPMWGLGFFILVNRAVQSERSWLSALQRTPLVTAFASVGVFSYSLYLTHELVIMESWLFTMQRLPSILNTLLIVTPATVAFAWMFFQYCEKPYMRKPAEVRDRSRRQEQEEQTSLEPTVLASSEYRA